MKARIGFVSNSSSSSFILYFPKGKPRDVLHMKQALFGRQESQTHKYDEGVQISTMLMAEKVLNEMKLATRQELFEAMRSMSGENLDVFGFYERAPQYDDPKYKMPARSKTFKGEEMDYDRQMKDHDMWSHKGADALLDYKKTNGGTFYVVEYGDDSQLGSHMEHGNIFKKIKHVRISHH